MSYNELDLHGVELQLGDMAIDGSFQQVLTATEETLAAERTLTFDEIKGGVVLFDLTGSQNVVTPTATAIREGLIKRQEGSSIRFGIRNASTTPGELITLVGGAGVTLFPTNIVIAPQETIELLVVLGTAVVGAETVGIQALARDGQMLTGVYHAPAPAVAAVNDVVDASTELGGGVVDMIADLIAGSIIFPRTLRATLANPGGVAAPGTLTITGTDQDGVVISEVLTFAGTNAETQDTAKAFASITALSSNFVAARVDETLSIGNRDVFGLPTRPYGRLLEVFKQLERADVLAGTGAVTAETVGTVDYTNRTVVPVSVSDSEIEHIWFYRYA